MEISSSVILPTLLNESPQWHNVDDGYESGVGHCQLESSPEPQWGGRQRVECSPSIVASQFRVLEFHIGFYIQSSPDAKSSIKCVPGVVSANQTWLHVEAMANLVRCLQNDSTLTRLSQRWLLQRDSGMHWAMLAFPDISGKGGG